MSHSLESTLRILYVYAVSSFYIADELLRITPDKRSKLLTLRNAVPTPLVGDKKNHFQALCSIACKKENSEIVDGLERTLSNDAFSRIVRVDSTFVYLYFAVAAFSLTPAVPLINS
jgi:hypothetical protein